MNGTITLVVLVFGVVIYLYLSQRGRLSDLLRRLEMAEREREKAIDHLDSLSRSAARELDLVHRQLRRRAFDLHDLFTTSGEIRSISSLHEFLSSFMLTLIGHMRCTSAALFLPVDQETSVFTLQYEKGLHLGNRNRFSFTRDSELYRRLSSGSGVVPLSGVEPDPAWAEETRPLRDVGLVAAVPLVGREKLLGAAALGPRLDGEPYRDRDWELLSILLSQVSVTLENALLFERLNHSYQGTIQALVATIDAKDPSTVGHTQRTSRLATKVAEKMGLEGERLEMFTLGTLLHDIGKIGLPESILRRSVTTPINPGQLRLIQQHPMRGAEILGKIPFLGPAVDLARHHHERYDGLGYPDGLKGEGISLEARILAVADSYEAMTAPRKYKERRSPAKAVKEIRECAGTQFDPTVVEVLVQVLDEEKDWELPADSDPADSTPRVLSERRGSAAFN